MCLIHFRPIGTLDLRHTRKATGDHDALTVTARMRIYDRLRPESLPKPFTSQAPTARTRAQRAPRPTHHPHFPNDISIFENSGHTLGIL